LNGCRQRDAERRAVGQGLLRRVGCTRVAAAEYDRQRVDADIRQVGATGSLERMLRRHVRDFVTNDRGELVLVLRDLEQPAEHADLAAGHRERVDRFVLEYAQRPVDVVVRRFEDFHDRLRHAGDKVDRLAIRDQRHAGRHLVERPVRLGFDLGTRRLGRLRGARRQGKRNQEERYEGT
jgi:hypothetical protein